MRRYCIMIAVMLVPLQLFAAEPMVIQVDKPEPKRFFPLDEARQETSEKQHGITLTKEKKPFLLRSDSQQMRDGFMRIDRARAVPIPLQRALPTTTQTASLAPAPSVAPTVVKEKVSADTDTIGATDFETDSEEIEGNRETVNPVLALFGASDAAAPSSFRDAMLGRTSGSIYGLTRHIGWPVPLNVKQYMSSGYGMRADPFHGRPTFHGGIDIATDVGTPVLATADAEVAQVTQDTNYGKYITLKHADGMLSRYGHLSAQTVREGQRVKMGQVIGAVGSTGRSTGAHLDYRVSKNGMKFDPLSVLNVPSSVPIKAGSAVQMAVAVQRGTRVASNALPKRPMVIQVR